MTEDMHPADAFLEAQVSAFIDSDNAFEMLSVLAASAGGIDNAFLNIVNNSTGKVVRLTLFKILMDYYESGEYELVLDVMGFVSSAVSYYDPTTVEQFKQKNRENYERLMNDE